MGRSPLVAIKVTKPKPAMVVLHGININSVDKIAIKIAASEKIMLVVSKLKSESDIIKNLREEIK